jgi:hypothetical protein
VSCLKWSAAHVVFVPVMDDEHEEIFRDLNQVQLALSGASQQLHLPTRFKP